MLHFRLAIPQYVDVVETTPTPGVDYKFGFELPQGTYFFNGGMDESGKYGNTTDLSEGYVTVQVEEVNEKYRLFFMDGEAKKYIEMKEVDENGTMKQRFRIVDEPVATYDWDSTFNTFTVELSGTKYYMGTYSSGGKDPFSTISVSAYSYLEKNPSTQYPVHLFKKVLASEVPTVITSIKDALKALIEVINRTENPIEKALIAVLMIAYIQPFEDGNKRTSRILGNALLLANDYCPLSYRSVDEVEYKKAIIMFYEQNNATYFKKLFLDQYKQAVKKYF